MEYTDIHRQAIQLCQQAGYSGQIDLEPIPLGGNNRVFKLTCGNYSMLLKSYFHHEEDTRDRLGNEFTFLTFVWNHGINLVPKPIACDRENHLGLYEFVKGKKLTAEKIKSSHISQSLEFFQIINRHRNDKDAKKLPLASEACFSIKEHISCINSRMQRLKNITGNDSIAEKAVEFIASNLLPSWEKTRASVNPNWIKTKNQTEEPILGLEKCLSPSDCGFHNVIVGKNGTLRFVDFEYAGWDDPAKMVSDYFCQPEIPVPIKYFAMFVKTICSLSSNPDFLRSRILVLLPLYRFKWCAIILNDFLTVDGQRRKFATDSEIAGRKAKQLYKAQKYFKTYCQGNPQNQGKNYGVY